MLKMAFERLFQEMINYANPSMSTSQDGISASQRPSGGRTAAATATVRGYHGTTGSCRCRCFSMMV
jgi:hypothetical protein